MVQEVTINNMEMNSRHGSLCTQRVQSVQKDCTFSTLNHWHERLLTAKVLI